MKFFGYQRLTDGGEFKFFGLSLYRHTTDYMTFERNQKFLCGLISTIRKNDIGHYHLVKQIKFFGKTIINREENGVDRIYYCFNRVIKKIPLIKIFEKNYLKLIDKKYDDVYLLHGNSGEIYLFLTYFLDAYLKKNQSKNPLFIATKKYHIDMIKMICPEIPYVFSKRLGLNLRYDNFKTAGHRFFIVFTNNYFNMVEQKIKSSNIGEYNYFDSISDCLGIEKEDLKMRKIVVTKEYELSMLEKIKKINLNIDKFIFIAPEAVSSSSLDEKFWIDLIQKYHNEGYDVFINITQDDVKYGNNGYKTCDLNFCEAFALAKEAKKIIMLRSGFSELLLQTNVEMDVLYTKFRYRHVFQDMSVEKVLSGFSLYNIPKVKKDLIKEIVYSEKKAEFIR